MPKKVKPTVTTEEYLKTRYPEPLPRWLRDYRPGDARPTFATLMSSRVVYYPACGTDGEPVRIFNQSRSAHVFLYVDWMFSREDLDAALECRYFTGYHRLDRFEYSRDEVAPPRYVPHLLLTREIAERSLKAASQAAPFCRAEILERDADRDDDFGAEKLAIVFLCADGFMTYDVFFGSRSYPAPFAAVLHDYGMVYDTFGRGGLLERCAIETGAFPELLLMAHKKGEPWRGYEPVEGIRRADAGGDYIVPHDLYRRI